MNSFNLSKLENDVHKALKLWNRNTSNEAPLSYLVIFNKFQKEQVNLRKATDQLILEALKILEIQKPRYAQFLRQRYIERMPISYFVNQISFSERTIYGLQKEGIYALAETVHSMEVEAQLEKKKVFTESQLMLEEQLGSPSTSHIIGIQPHINSLIKVLSLSKSPWIVCLSGIGGIGKTTLGNMLLRQMITQDDFSHLGWVSAQQREFNLAGHILTISDSNQTIDDLINYLIFKILHIKKTSLSPDQAFRILRHHLKEQPYLIVLDNFENLKNSSLALKKIRRLANPTKFLLTSRINLYWEPHVYHFIVPPLNQENALKLLREEARVRHLPHLVETTDAEFEPLYEMIGGNPLALRLILGQTHIHDLDTILDDLKEARGTKTDNLYTYIYRQAWDSLDDISRRLFLAMPHFPDEGGNRQSLQHITELSLAEVNHALDLLVTLNLVNVKKGSQEWLYSINPLTRTFLEKQVLKWQ